MAEQQTQTADEMLEEMARDFVQFRTEILPLREAADRGDGSYTDYDEAFNEWAEGLIWSIESYLKETGRLSEV